MNSFPVSAGSIITDEDGRILLVKEGKEHIRGRWDFPGGSLEPGENIRECALREAREEVNLDINLESLIGVYTEVSMRTGDTVVVFMFHAKTKSREVQIPESDEIIDAEFFSMEEAMNKELRKDNRYVVLEDFKEGQSLPLDAVKDVR